MGFVVGDKSWNGEDEELVEIIELTSSIIKGSGTIPSSRKPTNHQEVGLYDFSDEEKEWRKHALCRGLDNNIFFPERGHSMLRAYAVCRGCPVRYECLEWAIETGDKWGIRGGFTPEERTKIRKRVEGEKISYELASTDLDEKRYKRLMRAMARVGVESVRALHQYVS